MFSRSFNSCQAEIVADRARGTGTGSAERGAGAVLELAVDVEVDLLVVEAGEARDLLAFRQRGPVDPHQVRVHAVAGIQRPVGSRALVRAVGLGRRREEALRA